MQCKCGREAGESQFVDFDYAGLRFSHLAKDSSTCLECLKKQTAEFFEKYGREFISIVDGKIKVNWRLFGGYAFLNKNEALWHERRVLLLEWLNIISTERSENFVFVPDHLNIQIAYTEKYAFTRFADIIDYGRLVHGNRTDTWAIKLIVEKTLLSKEDVLRL